MVTYNHVYIIKFSLQVPLHLCNIKHTFLFPKDFFISLNGFSYEHNSAAMMYKLLMSYITNVYITLWTYVN